MVRMNQDAEQEIRKLYTEAFPADERAPFSLMMKRAQQNKADFWILTDKEKQVGMAYVLRQKGLAYLFYLAIHKTLRGQGYGTQAIKTLRDRYAGSRFFLALEIPDPDAANYEQRLKRHDFYLRCGLSDLPYHIKEHTVIYDIMGAGGIVEPEEYKALINSWLGWPMKWLIDMRIIK